MNSRLARAGVVGAMAVGAVVAVTSVGAPGGAQADATTTVVNPGLDTAPAVSDDGRTVVFVSTPGANDSEPSLFIHDRGGLAPDGTVLPSSTTPIADSLGASDPAISGNGCIVTWSVPSEAAEAEPESQPATDAEVVSQADTPIESGSDGSIPSDSVPADGAAQPVDAVVPPSDVVVDSVPESEVVTSAVEPAALQIVPPRIVVLDRCTDPATNPGGVRVDLPLAEGDRSFGPAVASNDGSVIAVSNGTDVVRFAGSVTSGYGETDRFDGRDSDATDHFVADRVDVSDDGSVVVFSGGLDLADNSVMTVFAHVTEDGQASTTPVLPSATAPTVSGDGTLVVASSGSAGSSVSLVDRTSTPLAPIDLGPGRRPAISADGNHVVFEEGANLAILSRTGQGAAAFATTQRTLLSTTITPTRSGPVIDRLGTTVVSDRDFDVASPPADTDIAITSVGADASFDAAMFDLGKGDLGVVLTSTVSFSNRGPASIGVADISVDGTFTIADDRCGDVIRPGTTCGIDVSFTVEQLEDAFGIVTLTPTSVGIDPFTTEVKALGEAPPAVTPSTTATTTPGSTTGGSTTGGTTTGSTRGSTTRGSTTRGSTTSGGTSRGGTTGSTRGTTSTGGSSTSGTRGTTATTSTTIAPGAGVTASPAAFDFAPTIVDAGRRTGLVEIVNNGSGPATVVGVRLDPAEAGPFQVVETTCAGESVAVGARCAVTLSFAPTTTGDQAVSLIASIQGGTDITVAVTGTGAPAPTVVVNPGVATIGQVVTLSGAGFPTGVTVEVDWNSIVREVVVDDAGTFNVPVVVMQHTPTGPAIVSVEGQTDLFGNVTGSMVVTHTSDRAGPTIIEGIGPNIGG